MPEKKLIDQIISDQIKVFEGEIMEALKAKLTELGLGSSDFFIEKYLIRVYDSANETYHYFYRFDTPEQVRVMTYTTPEMIDKGEGKFGFTYYCG